MEEKFKERDGSREKGEEVEKKKVEKLFYGLF